MALTIQPIARVPFHMFALRMYETAVSFRSFHAPLLKDTELNLKRQHISFIFFRGKVAGLVPVLPVHPVKQPIVFCGKP